MEVIYQVPFLNDCPFPEWLVIFPRGTNSKAAIFNCFKVLMTFWNDKQKNIYEEFKNCVMQAGWRVGGSKYYFNPVYKGLSKAASLAWQIG